MNNFHENFSPFYQPILHQPLTEVSLIMLENTVEPCYSKLLWCGYTVLSWASVHGHSQSKRHKLRVGGYTEKVLEWLGARAHSGCKVSCQGVPHRRFVLRRGQPDSEESCIVLQGWPTRSLVAKFPQHPVVACSTQISCCKEKTLWMRPKMGVCEPLMPDVVASNVQSQLCELSGPPSDSIRKNLAWWAVTQMCVSSSATKIFQNPKFFSYFGAM